MSAMKPKGTKTKNIFESNPRDKRIRMVSNDDMLPQIDGQNAIRTNNSMNNSQQNFRPKSAMLTKISSPPGIEKNGPFYHHDIKLANQHLVVKDADLELAKAKFDFQVTLEKQKTTDYQVMLKENYDQTTKMYQRIYSEKVEVLQKEHESIVQKIIARHNDEIISLTSDHEKQFKKILNEKNDLEKLCERKLRQAEDEYQLKTEKQKADFDKSLNDQIQTLTKKHEKKFADYKQKMKDKYNSLKTENEAKFQDQLQAMFEKLNSEYEKQQEDTFQKLIEKDDELKQVNRKLEAYSNEVNKWKEAYLELQQKQAELESEAKKKEIGVSDASIQCESTEPTMTQSIEIKEENLSEKKLLSRIGELESIQKELEQQNKLLLQQNKKPAQKKESPVSSTTNLKKSSYTTSKETVDKSIQVEINVEQQQQQQPSVNESQVLRQSCQGLIKFQGQFNQLQRLGIQFEQNLNDDKKQIKTYQDMLIKCLEKLKQYQLLIQKMSIN